MYGLLTFLVVAPGLQRTGSVVKRTSLGHTALVAAQHLESSQTRDRNPGPQHWQADSYPLPHEGSPAFSLAISLEMEGRKEMIVLKPFKQGGLGRGCHCRLSSFSAGNPRKLR